MCTQQERHNSVSSPPPKMTLPDSRMTSHWGRSALTLNRGRPSTQISTSQSLVRLGISQALATQNAFLGLAARVRSSQGPG